jgi:pilus assembly protein FimV
LLLAWLLIARRQEKAINDNDLMESLDNFDESFESLDNDIKQDDNLDTKGHQDFFSNIDNTTETSDDISTRSAKKVSLTIDNAIEDDILQEADVYIVYGLHDQAEAELKKAIADQPQKLEYRQKLLENYLASNNQAAFDQHAEKLQSLEGNNKPEIWEKVQEMGLKISPDNVLYQSKKTADIDTAVFSEIETPSETATDTETNKKVDDSTFVADINDTPSTNQQEKQSNTAKPSALTLIDTQFTAEAVKSSDTNLSTNKQLQAVDSDDFSLDDLEKELDAQAKNDNHHDASNIINFETALSNDDKAKGNADNKLALASLNLSVNSATGIDKILPKGTPYTSSSNSSQRNDIFSQQEEDILAFLDLPDEDFDLHEAHISTKLELARAYLDMGDIECARSTLEEVIVEGSDDQKREAEDLLHQTG